MTNKDGMKFLSPAHSALYRAIDGLIFMRDNYACQVNYLYEDANSRNLKIKNLKRLKKILFNQIWLNYTTRINKYKLKFDEFPPSKIDDLKIVGHKIIPSMEKDTSGTYKIYPRTFVCSKCGDLRNLNNEEWNEFNPNKCRNPACNGKYEQLSILMFCCQCGGITNLYYSCKEHKTEYIQLIRGKKDSLLTWEVVCRKCQEEGKKEPIDIFRFLCSHKDEHGNTICDEKSRRYKPLTIREGGVISSVVLTTVDIPPTKHIELEGLEYILLGLYLGKFDDVSKKRGSNITLGNIEEYFEEFNSDSEFVDHEGVKKLITNINVIISDLKDKFNGINLENLNDYFVIKNIFSAEEEIYNSISYTNFLDKIEDEMLKKMKIDNYSHLKEEFGIEDITYISNINLISSAIGTTIGINQFYNKDFVPHFNPIWENKNEKDKFIAYSYPFETEGILIDLNKIKVCEWLIENNILDEKMPNDQNEALEILLKLKFGSDEYNAVKTLLHTFSHTLISRSSLYTGLDSDSCSEIIFVNSAAFLIYSTSNINIGGFLSVFENSIFSWFDKVKIEMNDCTFDPACILENGACFSCLYLPEFVCSEFNQYLDRNVFIGRKRYEVSYW